MGVDPDLQRDHSTDEIGVEIANVALMGDKPCKVIQIAGCRRAVEARDLLGDVLLQSRRTGSSHGGGETSSLLDRVDSSAPKGLWIVSDHLPRRSVTP